MMNCRYLGGEQVPGKKSQVKKMNITPLPYLVATKSIRGRDLKHSLGYYFVITGRDQKWIWSRPKKTDAKLCVSD